MPDEPPPAPLITEQDVLEAAGVRPAPPLPGPAAIDLPGGVHVRAEVNPGTGNVNVGLVGVPIGAFLTMDQARALRDVLDRIVGRPLLVKVEPGYEVTPEAVAALARGGALDLVGLDGLDVSELPIRCPKCGFEATPEQMAPSTAEAPKEPKGPDGPAGP